MSTNVHSAAGSTLYIGGTGDLESESSWVEVGEIVGVGEFGPEDVVITHKNLAENIVYKFKGSRDNGALPLTLGQDPTDSGQIALEAAEATNYQYNFKVELNDAPDSSGATNTIKTFKGIVSSFKTNVPDGDNIVGVSCNIAISGDITTVYAAA